MLFRFSCVGSFYAQRYVLGASVCFTGVGLFYARWSVFRASVCFLCVSLFFAFFVCFSSVLRGGPIVARRFVFHALVRFSTPVSFRALVRFLRVGSFFARRFVFCAEVRFLFIFWESFRLLRVGRFFASRIYRSARNTRCRGTKTYSPPPPPTGQTTGLKWTIFGRDNP